LGNTKEGRCRMKRRYLLSGSRGDDVLSKAGREISSGLLDDSRLKLLIQRSRCVHRD
jgi:hypothetical protein